MSKKSTIKILISCHKPTSYIKNEILEPIQLNCANAKCLFDDMLHDNDGNNISNQNPKYCELTAQYWAWKNLKSDYYGFFHYRRYLSFSEKKRAKDEWGNVLSDTLNDSAINEFGLDESTIRKVVEENDIIIPSSKNIKTMPHMGKNMYEQFCGSGYLHSKDLDILVDVIKEKYPEFLPITKKYLHGHTTYFNNMFIMKKELFDKYSSWLFDILSECEKKIDYSNYSTEAIRTLGHLAERLFNVYILYLKQLGGYKIKELDTIVFLDTTPKASVAPAFKSKNIPIVLSASDNYSPFLAALLTSIRENSSKNSNYDIIILHTNITPDNQKRLSGIFQNFDNFSLRFLNVHPYEGSFKQLFTRGHFTIETWYRLLIPDLLSAYNEVIYLDSDMIILDDVAKLIKSNTDDSLLCACHDADTAGLYNGFEPTKRAYMDTELQLRNPYDYFQAGVLVLNLANFRKKYTTDKMLALAASKDWELLDQDVLNVLADGNVEYLDSSWNVMFDWQHIRIRDIISRAPKYLFDDYMKAHADPKIIHYAGPDKPWMDPGCDYGYLFWKYSRMTDYYEETLAIMNNAMISRTESRIARNLSARGVIKNRTKRIIRFFIPANSRVDIVLKKTFRRY